MKRLMEAPFCLARGVHCESGAGEGMTGIEDQLFFVCGTTDTASVGVTVWVRWAGADVHGARIPVDDVKRTITRSNRSRE